MVAVLEEKTRHSTRWNRVWRVETRHRPPESSDWVASGSVQAGFSVWSGKRVTWTPLRITTQFVVGCHGLSMTMKKFLT